MNEDRMSKAFGWRTQDEWDHIDAIPSAEMQAQLKARGKPPRTRKQTLENYIRAAMRRDVWGNVNKDAAIAHARLALRAEAEAA